MLQNLVSVKSKVAQMYVKNISLASVEFAFRLPTNLLPLSGKDLPTPRVLQICFFLDQHYNKLSVFDDIKDYIGQLSFDETKSLLDVMIPKISEKVSEDTGPVHSSASLVLTNLRLRIGKANSKLSLLEFLP